MSLPKKIYPQTNRTEKITAYLSTDALKRCNSSIVLLDQKSHSPFIEQAINFIHIAIRDGYDIPDPEDKFNWGGQSVKNILDCPEYMGFTVNFRTY